MDDIKSLEQERNELNTLINKGVVFEIDDIEIETKKVFFGLIKKHIPVKLKREFKIEEPTLGTLDRLSAEWIEFAIDESILKSDDGMQKVRKLVAQHAVRCARVIALSVLGSDYLIPKCRGACVAYVEDKKKLNELTSLFSRTIKPSQLYQLYTLISAMSNYGDFLNSIRLMSIARTTMPIRIEENNEA